MKKTMLLMLMLGILLPTHAQDSQGFYRIGIGTATDIDGYGVSLGVGRQVRNWEFSGRLACWRDVLGGQSHMMRTVLTDGHSHYDLGMMDAQHRSRVSAGGTVGFNLVSLIATGSRHRLTPGIGVVFAVSNQVTDDMEQNASWLSYESKTGLRLSYDLRYEYSLTPRLAVGAFAEMYSSVIGKAWMGLTLRRNFK